MKDAGERVKDAADKVGKTTRIRIERATPELVYAVLAAAPTGVSLLHRTRAWCFRGRKT